MSQFEKIVSDMQILGQRIRDLKVEEGANLFVPSVNDEWFGISAGSVTTTSATYPYSYATTTGTSVHTIGSSFASDVSTASITSGPTITYNSYPSSSDTSTTIIASTTRPDNGDLMSSKVTIYDSPDAVESHTLHQRAREALAHKLESAWYGYKNPPTPFKASGISALKKALFNKLKP